MLGIQDLLEKTTQTRSVEKAKIKQLLGKDSNATHNQDKNNEWRKEASCLHEIDRKEPWDPEPLLLFSTSSKHLQNPVVMCVHLFWSPGTNHMCTVLDSWSDSPANRQQAGGLSGCHSFEELLLQGCQKLEVFLTEKHR